MHQRKTTLELALNGEALVVLSFSMLASVPEIAGCGAVHTMRLWQIC
jgi:hypothetical protein